MVIARTLATFAPGDGIAVLTDRCLLVVARRDEVRIEELVAAVGSSDPVDAVVSELARDGVRRTPPFCLVVAGVAGATVLVRGAGSVVAQLATGGSITVTGETLATWTEHQVGDAVSFTAVLDDEAAAPTPWRVAEGVIPAVGVHGWRATSTPGAAPTPGAERGEAGPVTLDPNLTLLPVFDGRAGGVDADATWDEPRLPAGPGAHRAGTDGGGAPPTVVAVRCPAGHPNPPDADACRACGRVIVDRSTSIVPRPSLGWLRFDTGPRVEILRPMLVGRKPPTDETIDGEPAVPVVIADAEQMLSRLHLEVRIAGWEVFVVDRRSVNATYVSVPGRPLVKLASAEPYAIGPGTTVSLGDMVSFIYEAPRS